MKKGWDGVTLMVIGTTTRCQYCQCPGSTTGTLVARQLLAEAGNAMPFLLLELPQKRLIDQLSRLHVTGDGRRVHQTSQYDMSVRLVYGNLIQSLHFCLEIEPASIVIFSSRFPQSSTQQQSHAK